MIAVLKLMVDDNYRVQEAACSALSKLCSEGSKYVEFYLSDILQVNYQEILLILAQIVQNAAEIYNQKETIKYLYDAIGSLAYNGSKSVIQSENNERILMDIIKKQWNRAQFNSIQDKCLIGKFIKIISLKYRMH